VIVAISLFLRLGVAWKLGLNQPPRPGSDQYEYDTYAWNLAQGRGYRGLSPDVTDQDHLTAYRTPGLSVMWAALYCVSGRGYNVVRVGNCLLGVAAVALVYGIGRRCFGVKPALLAAAAFSIWPTGLLYSADLVSEPLYTCFLCGYLLVALKFAEKPSSWSLACLAGLLLGGAMLTRANALFMVLLALLWAFGQFRNERRQLLLALVIPLVAIISLAPWTIRNYQVFHAFIPLSTGGGDVLLGGNNRVVATDPKYYGYWVFPTSQLPEFRDLLRAPNDELKRDRIEKRLAVEWLKENPDKWWYLFHSKLRRALTPFLQPESPPIFRWGMFLSWGPVLLVGGAAFFPTLVHFLRSHHPGWILHLGILHFLLTAVVFWGSSRFRYPVEGLFVVLASAGVIWIGSICKFFSTQSP
jgi:4-amino-4-deoxy-L-arabinose transferase-like glycosyltransferase